MQKVVIDFKIKLKKENLVGLVLDVDDTIAATAGFWMGQMVEKFGNPEGLSTDEMVSKYRFVQNIPYFQTDEAKAWIKDAMHVTGYSEQVPLVANANHFANQISQNIIPIVGYVTARPVDFVGATKFWLKKHGFPKGEIIAKPNSVGFEDAASWKAKILKYLYPQVVGIVDDNPGLVEQLDGYKGTVYLYETEKSLKGDIKVVPCKNWTDVHAQIKLLHGNI